MNDKAFTFQTLHPDTIIDALFAQGIRVDSGLTPLNSYENRVYQFQDEDRRRMVVKFYRPERWSAAQILDVCGEHLVEQRVFGQGVGVLLPGAQLGRGCLLDGEIGRASCRERVSSSV